MEHTRRFIRHANLSYKALHGKMDVKEYTLYMIIGPVLQMLFWGFLVRYIHQGENLAGYIASNALLLCVFSAVFGMMTVVMSDRMSGTLPIVITTPTNKTSLFIARTIPHVFNGIVIALVGLIVGFYVFDLTISIQQIGYLVMIWGVSIFAACCLGLILGSLSLWTPSMHMLSNFLASLLLLLSGASYSLSILPNSLQYLANILPLTRGVELTKQLLNEGVALKNYSLLIEEFVLGVIYLGIGLFILFWAERLARKKGTLELET